MDLTDGQDPGMHSMIWLTIVMLITIGGPSSGRGKTPATGESLRLITDNMSCPLTLKAGLRRSGRIITQTKKLQEELASASKEQGKNMLWPLARNY